MIKEKEKKNKVSIILCILIFIVAFIGGILSKQIQPKELRELNKYSYRKLNGALITKDSQFYFDKFIIDKDGTILSVRKNEHQIISEVQPLFFMFVDINGVKKPNRIGRDIFFVNIYRNNISALGNGRLKSKLKSNCSPIGTGLYCSEYYLLGGKF